MPFYDKNIVTLFEFGTSKISVLHGCRGADGVPEVISFASRSSDSCVVKGAITDYNKALKIMGEVLAAADKMNPDASNSSDRRKVYFLVGSPGVTSRRGEGSVIVAGSLRKVTAEHIFDAVERARNITTSAELVNIGTYDSYFMLDRNQKVHNPCGMVAGQLDAYVHIISDERKRIESVNTMLRESGFDRGGEGVFTAVADAFGCLTSDEREHGVCLVDFGAGVCSYILVSGEGVYLSGVLGVGTDNIANDLAIGLDLPFDYCRRFLSESKLEELRGRGLSELEYTVQGTGRVRRIPLDSFEKIMDFRLREIFTILREKFEERNSMSLVGAGAVLCGGGAGIPSALNIMKDVFSVRVRRGEPSGITGSMTAFEGRMPASCAILGLLKYALESGEDEASGALDNVKDALNDFTDRVIRSVGVSIGKVFKK